MSCVFVVTVYWASQLIPFISGTDSDADAYDEDDRYDSLGYGFDFEAFLDECSDQIRYFYLADVLRDVRS